MYYLSGTTESPMCRILKTAQNFRETMANSSHRFVLSQQIALHADGCLLFKISPSEKIEGLQQPRDNQLHQADLWRTGNPGKIDQ